MASRQGLKPAKRPAAKTVAAENIVRSLREFLVMNVSPIGVVIELSLAEADDRNKTNTAVSKIVLMQYCGAGILVLLVGYILGN